MYPNIALMKAMSMGEVAVNGRNTPPTPTTDTVTITTQPQDVDCYVGGTATLSIVAESDDETATLSYQWQVYGEDWTDIVDATSTSYSASTAEIGDTNYRCIVTSDKGGTATSETAEVAVSAQPLPPVDHITITTQPTASTSVYVSQTATLSVVAESDDPDATLYYLWQVYNSTSEDWDDIVGASSSTYTAPTSTVGVNTYRVQIASSLSGTATSNSATVTVSADTVSIITNPGDTQVYINEGASVACEATSNAQGAVLSYQWQIYNLFDEDWTDISGATSATYSGVDTSTVGTQQFRCVVTSSYGGTDTTTSATVTVTQRDTITITAQPTTTSGYVGDTITLSVTAVSDNPNATLSYQWQVKDGATYDDISGATSSTYTVPTSTAGTERYRVIVSSDKGATDVTSNYADVTVATELYNLVFYSNTNYGYYPTTSTEFSDALASACEYYTYSNLTQIVGKSPVVGFKTRTYHNKQLTGSGYITCIRSTKSNPTSWSRYANQQVDSSGYTTVGQTISTTSTYNLAGVAWEKESYGSVTYASMLGIQYAGDSTYTNYGDPYTTDSINTSGSYHLTFPYAGNCSDIWYAVVNTTDYHMISTVKTASVETDGTTSYFTVETPTTPGDYRIFYFVRRTYPNVQYFISSRGITVS